MSTVRCDTDGPVLHIQLNRADKRNAIDDDMFVDLAEAAEAAGVNEGVAAVVLSGAGASFCAGLDFSVHRTLADEGAAGERPYSDPSDPTTVGRRTPGRGQRIVRALRDCPVPVIAAVHGHAIGGGLQIALACDIRIATADTVFASAEIDFGMTVDMGGSVLLPRLVGQDRALEMLLTARRVSGPEAERIGLVTRLADDPLDAAFALARGIAERSAPAVRASKRLCRLAETASVDDVMREELTVMSQNIGSPAQVEAADRFLAARRTKGRD